MRASDFILQTRADLQEKSQHWKNEELLVKLQRVYISLQFDLPCFVSKTEIDIKKGITEYYLEHIALKNISFKIDGNALSYADIEHFYTSTHKSLYVFSDKKVLINKIPLKDMESTLIYKYQKELSNINCEIEIPTNWHRALRLLFLSDIYEKPKSNSKDRNLSAYYLKLYDKELYKLKTEQKIRPKNITSNYQGI